ncbi:MAG: hypothetical protein ACK4NC_04750 [Candidatus Gracilibacteria bacterium]
MSIHTYSSNGPSESFSKSSDEIIHTLHDLKSEFFKRVFNQVSDKNALENDCIDREEINNYTQFFTEEIRSILKGLRLTWNEARFQNRALLIELMHMGENIQLTSRYLSHYLNNSIPQTPKIFEEYIKDQRLKKKPNSTTNVPNKRERKSFIVEDIQISSFVDLHHHLKQGLGGAHGYDNTLYLQRWFHEFIHKMTDEFLRENDIKRQLFDLYDQTQIQRIDGIEKMFEHKGKLLDIMTQMKELEMNKHTHMLDTSHVQTRLGELIRKEKKPQWVYDLAYHESKVKEKRLRDENRNRKVRRTYLDINDVLDQYCLVLAEILWDIEPSVNELLSMLQKHVFETKKMICILLQHPQDYSESVRLLLYKYICSLGELREQTEEKVVSFPKSPTYHTTKKVKTRIAMSKAYRMKKHKKQSLPLYSLAEDGSGKHIYYDQDIDMVTYYEKKKDGSQTRLSQSTQRKLFDEL